MPDFLDEKRQEIAARLKELKPLVQEHGRLEAAARALGGVGSAAPARGNGLATTPTAGKHGRPRRPKAASATVTSAKTTPAKTKAKGGGKAGRRKGSGARGKEALALVKGQPGITIPELAGRMGIEMNYLYRVLPNLAEEGKVQKKDRGWHPAGAA